MTKIKCGCTAVGRAPTSLVDIPPTKILEVWRVACHAAIPMPPLLAGRMTEVERFGPAPIIGEVMLTKPTFTHIGG